MYDVVNLHARSLGLSSPSLIRSYWIQFAAIASKVEAPFPKHTINSLGKYYQVSFLYLLLRRLSERQGQTIIYEDFQLLAALVVANADYMYVARLDSCD